MPWTIYTRLALFIATCAPTIFYFFSDEGKRLAVCDLESRWRERSAPEIAFQGGLENPGWTALKHGLREWAKSRTLSSGLFHLRSSP